MDSINLGLNQLYFDANNYRLRNHLDYNDVDDIVGLGPAHQKKAFEYISGPATQGYPGVADLLRSLRTNGYLPVDNILVREIQTGKYIVIEGNRRLAALKILKKSAEDGKDVENVSSSLFEEPDSLSDRTKGIEVYLHTEADGLDHRILAGLKHVSGNVKWARYNQAKLLYELKVVEQQEEGIIASKIGISPTQVREYIRAYQAIEPFVQYVKSEGIEDTNPFGKFEMFLTFMSKPGLREWVEWNNETGSYGNRANSERFFRWIAPSVEFNEDFDENSDDDEFKTHPPIIDNHKQIRKLADKIDDEEFLTRMEEEGSFERTIEADPEYSKRSFKHLVRQIKGGVGRITVDNIRTADEEDLRQLNDALAGLNEVLARRSDAP